MEKLKKIFETALKQATDGKGWERHGKHHGADFSKQPMQTIADMVGAGGPLFQAMKKIQEANTIWESKDRNYGARTTRELYGAMVYIAGAVYWMQNQKSQGPNLAAWSTEPDDPTQFITQPVVGGPEYPE
jgi:hypothetical protein